MCISMVTYQLPSERGNGGLRSQRSCTLPGRTPRQPADGQQSDALEKEGEMMLVEPWSLPLILSRKEHDKTNSYSSFPAPWPPAESFENLDQVEELSPTREGWKLAGTVAACYENKI